VTSSRERLEMGVPWNQRLRELIRLDDVMPQLQDPLKQLLLLVHLRNRVLDEVTAGPAQLDGAQWDEDGLSHKPRQDGGDCQEGAEDDPGEAHAGRGGEDSHGEEEVLVPAPLPAPPAGPQSGAPSLCSPPPPLPPAPLRKCLGHQQRGSFPGSFLRGNCHCGGQLALLWSLRRLQQGLGLGRGRCAGRGGPSVSPRSLRGAGLGVRKGEGMRSAWGCRRARQARREWWGCMREEGEREVWSSRATRDNQFSDPGHCHVL